MGMAAINVVEADAASAPPLLICVLVNWNGYQDTIECISSLLRQDYLNLKILVVDNGSTNGSADRIRTAHPVVEVIETGRNLGFPSGCNVGTRVAYGQQADFIWLLNNDTVCPPDTASKLVRTALSNPCAGVVGSVLYYMHDPTQIQAWGGGTINLWTGYVSHFTAPTVLGKDAFFTGASILFPCRICEEVGLFYEGFFMYSDDSDFGIRLHRAGYAMVMAEDTAILHKEGASSPKRSPLIDRFATTSSMRLLQRHAPLPFVSITTYLTLRLLNRVLRWRLENFVSVLHGASDFFRERRRIFSEHL
jgi:GT2 family glycosyltransferase